MILQVVLFNDKGFIVIFEDCKSEEHLLQVLSDWIKCGSLGQRCTIKITRGAM